jgi:hypothetical protein
MDDGDGADPWVFSSDDLNMIASTLDPGSGYRETAREDAIFIATFNPTTVLALIELARAGAVFDTSKCPPKDQPFLALIINDSGHKEWTKLGRYDKYKEAWSGPDGIVELCEIRKWALLPRVAEGDVL